MGPSVDNSSPKRFPHLEYRLKTRELRKDHANEIQLEDRTLLQKMLTIDTRKMPSGPGSSAAPTLHAPAQNRELDRITRANRQLLTRLEKTQSSMGTASKHNKEEAERKLLLQKMNANSNRWKRDLMLRVPSGRQRGTPPSQAVFSAFKEAYENGREPGGEVAAAAA